MSTIQTIKSELDSDPLGRGYSGMTDEQAADDLNTEYRTRNRDRMTGDEIFANVATRADWDALTDAQRETFLLLCARDEIDPFAAANVELVKSVFGDASQTITNLNAARVESISRATEIGVPFVKSGHVQNARQL